MELGLWWLLLLARSCGCDWECDCGCDCGCGSLRDRYKNGCSVPVGADPNPDPDPDLDPAVAAVAGNHRQGRSLPGGEVNTCGELIEWVAAVECAVMECAVVAVVVGVAAGTAVEGVESLTRLFASSVRTMEVDVEVDVVVEVVGGGGGSGNGRCVAPLAPCCTLWVVPGDQYRK